jgi:hypothetical protein
MGAEARAALEAAWQACRKPAAAPTPQPAPQQPGLLLGCWGGDEPDEAKMLAYA